MRPSAQRTRTRAAQVPVVVWHVAVCLGAGGQCPSAIILIKFPLRGGGYAGTTKRDEAARLALREITTGASHEPRGNSPPRSSIFLGVRHREPKEVLPFTRATPAEHPAPAPLASRSSQQRRTRPERHFPSRSTELQRQRCRRRSWP